MLIFVQGRFEIICLSGSYLVTDGDGSRTRSGGLSVSLASPDGRVIGGGVGGMLIAASPVQVIYLIVLRFFRILFSYIIEEMSHVASKIISIYI